MNLAWYTARAAGIVSWALLSAGTIWGLLMSSKLAGGRNARWTRKWLLDLHRFMGGLGTIFVGVHVAAILADQYVSFSPVQVLVPFTSEYRPAAVAWGIVALYLLVAVELTSLAKRRLSNRTWRLVHLASFPMFFLATIHMLTAGTDAVNPLLRGSAATSAIAVMALTLRRLSASPRAPRTAPPVTIDSHDEMPATPPLADLPPSARPPHEPPATPTTATVAIVGTAATHLADVLRPHLDPSIDLVGGWPLRSPLAVIVRSDDRDLAREAALRFPSAIVLVATPRSLQAAEQLDFYAVGADRVLPAPTPDRRASPVHALLRRDQQNLGPAPQLTHS